MLRIFIVFFMLPFSLLFSHTFSENGITPWGVDAELVGEGKKGEGVRAKSVGEKVCAGSIRFFQKYISEIDGPRSTFYPTSSEYTRQMICNYGVLQGIALGCDRLMRENHDPWVYRTVLKGDVVRKLDR